MEVISLIFDIEEKFDIEIPVNANMDIESKTLSDLIQAVDQLVAAKAKGRSELRGALRLSVAHPGVLRIAEWRQIQVYSDAFGCQFVSGGTKCKNRGPMLRIGHYTSEFNDFSVAPLARRA